MMFYSMRNYWLRFCVTATATAHRKQEIKAIITEKRQRNTHINKHTPKQINHHKKKDCCPTEVIYLLRS